MPCLPTWKRTLLIAKRDKLILQIAATEATIDTAIDRGHISNYEFESGEGKQKTGYRNINELQRFIKDLESELARVLNRLCSRGVVNLGLKRYQRNLNYGS